MNRGYLYLILSTLTFFVFMKIGFWPLRLVSLWISLSALWFGVGYLTGYGELLLKNRKGQVPFLIKLLLFPIFVGVSLYHLFARKFDKALPLQEIREGLWLGRRLTIADRQQFIASGVNAVLDVTAEFNALGSKWIDPDVEYFNIPVFDHSVPRLSQLTKAVKWISRQRALGNSVLIHCALGQGRSVTVLLAYLLYENPMSSPEELLREVHGIRSVAAPNSLQMKLLYRFKSSEAIHGKTRTRIIFNPVSGIRDAKKDKKEIEEVLGAFLDITFVETTPEISAAELTREALDEGVDQIIASGGDGTVAEVAEELMGTGIPMGIFPRGTANALAVCLYGPSIRIDPIYACAHHILSGGTKAIDAVECDDGRSMFLLAGIGIERGMVERADRELKTKYGALAYLVGGWQQIKSQENFELDLDVDGTTHSFTMGSVTVANAAPNTSIFAQGGGEPSMDDGLLDVTVITDVDNPAQSVRVMAELFSGKTETNPCIRHFTGREITLRANPPQKLVIDGEITGTTPITFRTIPGALKILCDQEIVKKKGSKRGGDDVVKKP